MRSATPDMTLSTGPRRSARRLGRLAALALAVAPALGACSGRPPSAEQRAAAQDELNPSGRPYRGPPGILSSTPPADSSFTPLYCHPEQQGTVCTRSR